ncbi:hypothetical protein Glove_209g147 [Diversispora epigaea]|uniref:V-SNARE coiled-coil homology domain-containing protein n=1 Tax=Diversispora epigaea TaxID=1348612 RepID=A0A397ISX0_9GLOM|nr:hypothetical protein Glove_209g147 [Diversispora epigaea]
MIYIIECHCWTTTTNPPQNDKYDPFVPKSEAAGGGQKTVQIQKQIDDTVGIMRENINRVAERGERLDALQDKTVIKFVKMTTTTNPPQNDKYDPFVPKSEAAGGGQKTVQIQKQIDDTVGIMRENINRVAERGERLDALQDKTENLTVSAQGFRRGANKVRKRMWWKDMKMKIVLIVVVILLLLAVILPLALKKKQ